MLGQALCVVLWMFIVVLAIWALAHTSLLVIGDGSLNVLAGRITGIQNFFGGLTGFLFSYFVFEGLRGYNAVKGPALGGLLGGLVNLLFLTNTWVPGLADGSTELEFKMTILRWGMAVYGMLCYVAGDGENANSPAKALQKVSSATSPRAPLRLLTPPLLKPGILARW